MTTEDKDAPQPLKVVIERLSVQSEPPQTFFQVEITQKDGAWSEVFGSENDLRLFLKGVQAGIHITGGFMTMPEIPRQVSRTFAEFVQAYASAAPDKMPQKIKPFPTQK